MPDRMWQRGPDGELRRKEPAPPAPAPESEDPRQTVRPRALRSLVLGLRDSYDYLGVGLAASFLWVTLAASLLFGVLEVSRRAGLAALALASPAFLLLQAAACLPPLVLVLGPLTGGIFRLARNVAAGEDPGLLDLLWGFRSALGRCAGLMALQLLVTIVLGADFIYLVMQRSLPLMIAGVFFGYLLLFWGLMSSYQWPLMVEQQISPPAAVRKSALLTLDNLGYTLAVGASCLVFSLFCWVLLLPAFIAWAAVLAFVQTRALRPLLQRYGLLPQAPDPDDPVDETWGHGWHE